MGIRTKNFNLTRNQFRQIISVDYFQRIKLILILFSVLILINLVISLYAKQLTWELIFTLIVIAYLVSIPFFVSLKEQYKLNFLNRYCEIDENFFAVCYEDGSIIKLKFDHFIKAVKWSEYYFLYITKAQFYYLPIAAFDSEKDMYRFDFFLQGKQLI
ncbi:MAG: YcxB family protein [Heteroscytonema crispum UTEX LB 1556]